MRSFHFKTIYYSHLQFFRMNQHVAYFVSIHNIIKLLSSHFLTISITFSREHVGYQQKWTASWRSINNFGITWIIIVIMTEALFLFYVWVCVSYTTTRTTLNYVGLLCTVIYWRKPTYILESETGLFSKSTRSNFLLMQMNLILINRDINRDKSNK